MPHNPTSARSGANPSPELVLAAVERAERHRAKDVVGVAI